MATELTEAQIEAFGQKLQTFAATLTAEEQTILETILMLAMGQQDEVQGYDAVSTQRRQQTAAQQSLMTTLLTQLAQTRHDTAKNIIGNIRA